MHRRVLQVWGLFFVLLSTIQILGIFYGPIRFVHQSSLVLAPIYAPGWEDEEVGHLRQVLERELATLGPYSLFPKSLIENFYLERDNAIGVFDGKFTGKEAAFDLARELGVESVAIASVRQYSRKISLIITVYHVDTNQRVFSVQNEFSSLEDVFAWQNEEGSSINLSDSTGMPTLGLGTSGWLYLLFLLLFLFQGLLMGLGGQEHPQLLEWIWSSGFLLALFSWIYALNGDMDYVQRFIATSGYLQLEHTGWERRATLLRYLPPLLVSFGLWARMRIFHWNKWGSTVFSQDFLKKILRDGAPLLALLSAFLYGFALPNFAVLEGIPLLAWVATIPLYLALASVNWKRGMGVLLFFVGVQSLVVNWWQGTFSYVSLPFTVTLSIVQSLPFVFLMAQLFRLPGILPFILSPLTWVCWDWIRSLGFLGYPWGILGVAFYGWTGLIQSAAFGGVWLVSFYPHLLGALGAWGVWDGGLQKKTAYRPLAGAVLGVALVTLLGFGIVHWRDAHEMEGQEVHILALQQNTDPRKHDYHRSFDRLSDLTQQALEESPVDLVVWPESAFVPDIRFWLQENRRQWKRGRLVQRFLDWQATRQIPLVTGTQDHDYAPLSTGDEEAVKRIYNSAMYLAPQRISDEQREYYYKMRLVPFTENFPYRKEFPWVAQLLHNFSTTQWTPGTQRHVFETPRFSFATPICFEDVFPNHVRKFVQNGAQVLVNISNDYWANTPLEGFQHGVHAIFRSVENRRPMVRATCSGYTIAVDEEGRIQEGALPFYEEGWLRAKIHIPQHQETTLYGRWGDWFPILCGFLVVLTLGIFLVQKRRLDLRADDCGLMV